jgi:glucose/arabinose dehydrogenase
MRRHLAPHLAVVALFSLLASSAAAVTLPANFVAENVVPGVTFDTPTAIAFLPGGRMLVAEKRGTVWAVSNGVKNPTPLISIDNEVLNEHDRGLLGIAVDPNYVTNKLIYLLYTVDPDSNGVDDNNNGFGRLTRYKISATDSNKVDPTSRAILMGVNWTQGSVSDFPSHTAGTLRFGTDGSLLVSIGDAASYADLDAGGMDPSCYGPGKSDPSQDIGAFRAQWTGSLNGKILRINPTNGQGYANNPYYDGNLASIPSRVWAYGLRNPFRFTVRPGTGVTDPNAGNPGTVVIGDVGLETWEEMDIVKTPGMNFGWPCYEGPDPHYGYRALTPAHNGCNSIGTASNPAQVTAPTADWHHTNSAYSNPVGLLGNCSIGGAFYTGALYPSTYLNRYFFADYGRDWIKFANLDANNNLVSITDFASTVDGAVDFAVEPVSKNLIYVSISTGQVRRIRYTGSVPGNHAPVAAASANPTSGAAPLAVNFSSAGSSDPDGDPLTYQWTFGDGQGSTSANPSHTYANAGTYSVALDVSDGRGGITRATLSITASFAAGSFPSTPVVDAFNRADGAIGGSWAGQTAGLTIASNRLTITGTDASTVWNGGTFGADQEAYVTLSSAVAGTPEQDLMLKVQGLSWDTGHIEVRYDATASKVYVTTYAPTQGWQTRATIAATYAAGDRLGARALSDGTVEVYKNATKLGTASTLGWAFQSAGGRIGMTLVSNGTTAVDDFGGGTIVSGANTPPNAIILSPVNGAFYYAGQAISLSGTGSDAQDPASALAYHWQMDIHHNNHVHYSSFVADGTSATLLGENHDDGTGVFFRVNLIVTDRGGLKDTSFVDIFPEIDLEPSAIAVTPASPITGTTATFAFKIYDRGRMPAPISRWRLTAGGTILAERDTIVNALDSLSISVPCLVSLPSGNYNLRVTVDTLGTVVETKENNNGRTQSLTVAPGGTPPPSGFPLTAVLDNFNRADGAIGANWADQTAPLLISGNRLSITNNNATTVWRGGTFGPDQEAYVTLVSAPPNAFEQDLMLKVQGFSWSGGHIEVRYDATASKVFVSTYTPASGWKTLASFPVTFVPGDRLGARARANGTVEVYRNTTLVGSTSAASWSYIALGGNIGLTLDALTAVTLDDFGGGTITSAAIIQPAMSPTDAAALGQRIVLSPPFPNPSTGDVSMNLTLPRAARIDFRVMDLQGRAIWNAHEAVKDAGQWLLRWPGVSNDGAPARPGLYLASVTVDGHALTRRMIVTR